MTGSAPKSAVPKSSGRKAAPNVVWSEFMEIGSRADMRIRVNQGGTVITQGRRKKRIRD
jgi:hypothetical protein